MRIVKSHLSGRLLAAEADLAGKVGLPGRVLPAPAGPRPGAGTSPVP